MDSSNNLSDVFLQYSAYMEDEQSLREEIRSQVRELEQTAREMTTLLQSVHQQDGIQNIPAICEKAKGLYPTIKEHYAALSKKVPKDQYYSRFHDHWRFVTQRMAFVAALLVYLETEQLATQQMVADAIGVALNKEDGFILDLEDYLAGLLMLSSELSRFVVNSVTAGDYLRPFRVAQFLSELSAGFRLLNLKNDNLRKRFDGLKYDLKKVEEVVYDLSIRGLKPKQET
ncbi:translin-like isoform X2 [Amphibalanus amphitrite]|uniref:translin-like isoform X2 n=1 Tax=Amphibalanus amphitrite TaxID=1232801 RepID=UPI001C904EA9|nr:translin-like isoform X2 [Amphibalanus amphitrite]XP_043224644.1 translin-like isoform X2 [Amphibalanus amphitrite]